MSVQGDLFDDHEDALPKSGGWKFVPPDPALIRANVREVIDQLVGASEMPWDEDELGYHQLVLPQTTNWLTPEERAELLREFDAEVARLTAG